MSMRQSKGFTLIELMVTLIVLAVLAAIAYPSFTSTIRNNRLATSGNELLTLLALARSEGIRNNTGGGVCGSKEGMTCDGTWSEGLMAWGDIDGDGAFSSGDTVLRFAKGNKTLTISTPDPEVITFDARGRRRSSTDQSVVMSPADCKEGEPTKTLTVNLSGQVRTERGECE